MDVIGILMMLGVTIGLMAVGAAVASFCHRINLPLESQIGDLKRENAFLKQKLNKTLLMPSDLNDKLKALNGKCKIELDALKLESENEFMRSEFMDSYTLLLVSRLADRAKENPKAQIFQLLANEIIG